MTASFLAGDHQQLANLVSVADRAAAREITGMQQMRTRVQYSLRTYMLLLQLFLVQQQSHDSPAVLAIFSLLYDEDSCINATHAR